MRAIILTLILLHSSFAFADWKVGSQKLAVVPCPNKGCYISKTCLEKKSKCSALKAYYNPIKGIHSFGGANPGSKICREQFSGKVNIATDEEGNQEAFCVFPDDTLLSLGGLWK